MQNSLIPIEWLHGLLATAPVIVLAILPVNLRWTARPAAKRGVG